MKIIKDFLLGKCDPSTFMQLYMNSDEMYEFIQNLIPKEAVNNPEHEYWKKCILRGGLECYNFDVRNLLYSHCGFGESEYDQIEIFETIRKLYLWVNPKQKCTNLYYDRIDFYLDLEADCFGGPEVSHIVKAVANEFLDVRPKAVRKKEAKEKMDSLFHIQGKNKPRWIHGPEWPMGTCSPMAFVSQKRIDNSCVSYEFADVNTGTTRIIRQYY